MMKEWHFLQVKEAGNEIKRFLSVVCVYCYHAGPLTGQRMCVFVYVCVVGASKVSLSSYSSTGNFLSLIHE